MTGMFRFGKITAITALFIVVAIVGALPNAARAATDSDYVLGSGDQVKITVFGEPDLTGPYEISGAGDVAFPLIGQVRAAGGTARDLEKRVAKKLKEGYLKNPTVSVEVLKYRPFFILGEVKHPGSYPYKNGLNVLNAVAMAGGYTYRAKSNVWMVTRAGDKKLQDHEITNGSFMVRPGDTIVVPERFF